MTLEKGDLFYTVLDTGQILYMPFDDSEWDRRLIAFGNASQDREYIEQRARDLKLYNLLSNFAYQVNKGWKADMSNEKWYIWFGDGWRVDFVTNTFHLNEVYFCSESAARQAIDEVIIPFMQKEVNDEE